MQIILIIVKYLHMIMIANLLNFDECLVASGF